ncbi:SusD/RagB family nutrient-binding outer membrane lipoprotein [Puteibacter caeruleilacunae]|nr:SusD/RagB family nutrient-binding outer membrane lipoprotein [Puteibacter caeruleilacunae]
MKIRTLNIIVLLTVLFSGCTQKDFDLVNTNINSVTEPNNVYLVNGALDDILNFAADHGDISDWVNHHSGGSSLGSQYLDFEIKLWDKVYGANVNLNDVIRLTEGATEEKDQYARAVALILQGFGFQRVTDTYGDIPFSEAGREENGELNDKPAYDTQQAIYYVVLDNLKEAINLIGEGTKLDMGTADRLYESDLQLWKRFANSIRLRMAIRMRFVDPSKASSVISDVMNYPLISSNAESAGFNNWDQNGYYYPKFNALEAGSRTNCAELMVDYLKSTDDLRLQAYALPVEIGDHAGEIVGLPAGYNGPLDRAHFSYIGRVTYQKELPTQNLMYSEVCFLLAEAYLYGVGVNANDATANDWYRKGIEASLEYWDREDEVVIDGSAQMVRYYNEDDVEAFMATDIATLSGTDEAKFEQIAMQKWVALMGNDLEAFAEMRRTGYPAVATRTGSEDPALYLGNTNGVWPRRVVYPDNEMLYNSDNYQKAYDATNRNSMLHKVWWDVN